MWIDHSWIQWDPCTFTYPSQLAKILHLNSFLFIPLSIFKFSISCIFLWSLKIRSHLRSFTFFELFFQKFCLFFKALLAWGSGTPLHIFLAMIFVITFLDLKLFWWRVIKNLHLFQFHRLMINRRLILVEILSARDRVPFAVWYLHVLFWWSKWLSFNVGWLSFAFLVPTKRHYWYGWMQTTVFFTFIRTHPVPAPLIIASTAFWEWFAFARLGRGWNNLNFTFV